MKTDEPGSAGRIVLRLDRKAVLIIISSIILFFLLLNGLCVYFTWKQMSYQFTQFRAEQNRVLAQEEQVLTNRIDDLKTTMLMLDEASNRKVQGAFGKVSSGIRKVDTVYSDLLAEQKKKTLDSVYTDAEVNAKYREALELIDKKKYFQANELLNFVVKEQADNLDARFYRVFSLFNMNTVDRNQYPSIQKELGILRQRGYDNPDIERILTFIQSEK